MWKATSQSSPPRARRALRNPSRTSTRASKKFRQISRQGNTRRREPPVRRRSGGSSKLRRNCKATWARRKKPDPNFFHHGDTEDTEVHRDTQVLRASPCPPCLRGEKGSVNPFTEA